MEGAPDTQGGFQTFAAATDRSRNLAVAMVMGMEWVKVPDLVQERVPDSGRDLERGKA